MSNLPNEKPQSADITQQVNIKYIEAWDERRKESCLESIKWTWKYNKEEEVEVPLDATTNNFFYKRLENCKEREKEWKTIRKEFFIIIFLN